MKKVKVTGTYYAKEGKKSKKCEYLAEVEVSEKLEGGDLIKHLRINVLPGIIAKKDENFKGVRTVVVSDSEEDSASDVVEKMNKDELKVLAGEMDIEFNSKTTKAQLVDLIKEAQEKDA